MIKFAGIALLCYVLFQPVSQAGDVKTIPLYITGNVDNPAFILEFLWSPTDRLSPMTFRNALLPLLESLGKDNSSRVRVASIPVLRVEKELEYFKRLVCIPQKNFPKLASNLLLYNSVHPEQMSLSELDKVAVGYGMDQFCINDDFNLNNYIGRRYLIDSLGLGEVPVITINGKSYLNIYFAWQLKEALHENGIKIDGF